MNIRKLGATLLGATMAGAALLTPALAATATLDNYPAPFVDNGNTNFLIVVGQNSNPADIVGAVNVAVRLGGERGELVTCGSSSSVSGAVDKELALNEALGTQFGDLRYNKLTGFQHGTIRWDSDDVDIDEKLRVDGLNITTSLADKDLGGDIYLGTVADTPEKFNYTYNIDDEDFDYTKVNDTTSKRLDIKLLDTNIQVISVTNGTTDEIVFKAATDVVLGVGESTAVSGNTIKVNSIGSQSVSVTVGQETKIIATGDEYDFGTVKVQVNSILYTDDVSSRQVDLSVGTDIEKTVKDGDSMELFGEPSDESEAEWLWIVDADNTDISKLTIGAKYHQKLIDHKDALRKVGEYFYLPNNYSRVSISQLNTDDYATISGEFDSFIDIDLNETGDTTSSYTGKQGIVLTSSKADTGFQVNVTGTLTETDTVYLLQLNTTAVLGAYEDSDNKIRIFYLGGGDNTTVVTDQLDIFYQDTNKQVTFVNNPLAMALTIKEAVEGDIVWDVDATNLQFGATQGQADAAELTINGVNKGTVEEDYRTLYGFIVRDPKSNGDGDKLEIAVPSEQVKATVLVEGPQSTTTGVPGSTVKKAVPIVDNIARLDTEVTESIKQSKNLILVGGPCVNTVTAQALGLSFPACGADSTIPQGAAIIKVVNNAFTNGLAALVVAGWDAENTRAACSVLEQFDVYTGLTGTGVEVDGTTNPTLKALQ